MSFFPQNSAFNQTRYVTARLAAGASDPRGEFKAVDQNKLEDWYHELDNLIHDTLAPPTHTASRVPIETIQKLTDLRDEIYSYLR